MQWYKLSEDNSHDHRRSYTTPNRNYPLQIMERRQPQLTAVESEQQWKRRYKYMVPMDNIRMNSRTNTDRYSCSGRIHLHRRLGKPRCSSSSSSSSWLWW